MIFVGPPRVSHQMLMVLSLPAFPRQRLGLNRSVGGSPSLSKGPYPQAP